MQLASIIQELRSARKEKAAELRRVDRALAAIGPLVLVEHNNVVPINRHKRKISAAGRRNIAKAQRARWAKLKGLKGWQAA